MVIPHDVQCPNIFEIAQKKRKKRAKNAETGQNGPKIVKMAVFQNGLSDFFLKINEIIDIYMSYDNLKRTGQ